MCEEEREELWLEGGGVRYVYTDDYVDSICAKVAELQSSHDALEAKLAKYQNLEPVGEIVKGEAGTMRHPVWKNDIYPDVGCKLYALKGY